MAFAAPYAMAAGLGISMYGTIQQGYEQAAMAKYNAKLAERDARIAKQNASYAASQKRRQTKRLMGKQRALYGKAGVTMEGSPLVVAQETAAEGEMDALMIERGYTLEAQRHRAEKHLWGMRGTAAKRAAWTKAGSTLLTGGLGAAGGYGGNR